MHVFVHICSTHQSIIMGHAKIIWMFSLTIFAVMAMVVVVLATVMTPPQNVANGWGGVPHPPSSSLSSSMSSKATILSRSSFNRCKYDPLIQPRVIWMVDAMTSLATMALVSSHRP
jgi:hypothetical protein